MDKNYWDKEIKEHWFKDHKATLTKQGNLVVIDWRKPDTNIFAVRYVFDGYYLYVSGDIGEAVFKFSDTGYLFAQDYSLDYFEGKLRAYSRERRDFDREKALLELNDRAEDAMDYNGKKYSEDAIEDLKSIINDCSTVREFQNKIHELDLYQFGSEFYDWLPELGSVYPGEIRAYLIGLQMANEQLSKDKVENR